MTTALTTPPCTAFLIDVPRYQRMIDLGVIAEDERIELIRGQLVFKMPQGDRHGVAIERIDRWLQRRLPDEIAVRCQCPIVATATSQPEPDIVLCRPANIRGRHHPIPADIFLIIEVAETSLRDDRTSKAPLFAEARIPNYWIVNLESSTIEVDSAPVGTVYSHRVDYEIGQSVVLTIGDFQLAVPVDAFAGEPVP